MRKLILAGAFATALTGLVGQATAASLDACVANLRSQALKSGISRSLVNKAMTGVKFNERAVRFSRQQPEFKTRIWDYMTFLVDPQRIADGKAMMKKHAKTLAAVEKRHKVDRYIVAALWGVESDFGKIRGEFFLPHTLANIVCSGKKPRFFTRELIFGLKLVQRGDVALNDLYGSWAGAFGQTQMLPSTYMSNAVDFNRDGKRDLVHSVPDALGSAANFLRRAGWRPGLGWGYEVKVPRGYRGPEGRKRRATLSTWGKRGITRLNGKRLSGGAKMALIMPAGRNGPGFLISPNFNAVRTYNAATSYALAISHLSDRLRGKGPIQKAWPTNDPGLTRKQRLELQKLLIKAGYDIGGADGKIGPITIRAIRKAQKKAGMKPTGRPSMKIYKALGG